MSTPNPNPFAHGRPPSASRSGPPWEQPLPLVGRYIQTVRLVLGHPSAFYAAMRREGGVGAPFLFALTGMAVGSIVTVVYQTIFIVGVAMAANQTELLPVQLTASLGWAVALVPLQVVFLFVSAGIMHMGLKMVGATTLSYETTLRVVAYGAGSVALWQLVPLFGAFVGALWGIVVDIIGLKRAHETTGGRATFAGLLPPVFGGCLVGIGGLILVLA